MNADVLSPKALGRATLERQLLLRRSALPVLDRELARHPDFGARPRGHRHRRGARLRPPPPGRAPPYRRPVAGRHARPFPEHDPAALAYACRNHLAFVQVPPRGVWGRSAQVTSTTAEAWLGRPLAESPSIDDVVVRYLGAFGPASVADVAAWSRLFCYGRSWTACAPACARSATGGGASWWTSPTPPGPIRRRRPHRASCPSTTTSSSATPTAPDSSRRRTASACSRAPGRCGGSVLHDGGLAGTWSIDRAGPEPVLVIHSVHPLARRPAAAGATEGRRLLTFLELDAGRADVRLVTLE